MRRLSPEVVISTLLMCTSLFATACSQDWSESQRDTDAGAVESDAEPVERADATQLEPDASSTNTGFDGGPNQRTCAAWTCPEHAACVERGGAATCECLPGFALAGSGCQEVLPTTGNDAGVVACSREGEVTCSGDEVGVSLVCSAGRWETRERCTSTQRCDVSEGATRGRCVTNDLCGTTSCANDGKCLTVNGAVLCECKAGYSGEHCQTDACQPNPCQHGGMCDRVSTGASCRCAGTGYEGARCEQNVDECARNLDNCDPNARCTDTPGGFTCQCPTPYLGDGKTCACPTGSTGAGCATCTAGFVKNAASACVPEYTVQVKMAGDGFGRVTFSAGVMSCGGDTCTVKVASGMALSIAANPESTSEISSWSEPGCTGLSCAMTVTSNKQLTVKFALAHNVIFATSSQTVPGLLGGLAQADAECARLAVQGGLEGRTWRAYLSTVKPCPGAGSGNCNAPDRLGGARGWVNRRGEPVIDTVQDLRDGRFFYPVRYTESAADSFARSPFSGTREGVVALQVAQGSTQNLTCGDYTDSSSDKYTVTGWTTLVAEGATAVAYTPCSQAGPFYCMSIDKTRAISIPVPSTKRLAFTTKTQWTSGGGVASADSLCQREACLAGLTGSSNCSSSLGTSRIFKAWLGTSSTSARSRFSSTGPDFYRIDNVLWMKAAGLTTSEEWAVPVETGLSIAADGSVVEATPAWAGWMVWTGDDRTDTCNNWTSTSTTAFTGANAWGHSYASVGWAFRAGGGFGCSGLAALYCLQQ